MEQGIFNSYIYDLPMPGAGSVQISPGTSLRRKIDALVLTRAGAVTVFYAREGEGRYKVTTIEPGKSDEVVNAV
ncbi:hypothetical protein E4P40_07730 [Blastococcus sp. CT_GayMR20]|uniref:hypothetical protein n=1 Tax=Blastococcus sp. CT_GayMR20 TaxID=2559609 RepID=UPI0010740FA8|nr:hypothetical protein [Blastococcus sp. CT_GayMR20]TFV90098.1 hypothetical protein E4P40_07730 [Blastococcus sp. CT_GayMR20]